MLGLTARIVSSTAAFLYPGYASYKTLTQRPASEADLERWLMYWSVLGCFVGVEYLAEWVLSWIPFYYTLKMMFLLYLVLPQTQGASYIYTRHLRPFLRAHETQIDEALAQLRARVYRFVQERLRALWGAVQPQPQSQAQAQAQGAGTGAGILGALWGTYGARIVASGTAFMTDAAAGGPDANSNSDVVERRRRLQAELAALDREVPGLRDRASSGTGTGRFEEVDVPSDVEGYDVGEGRVHHRQRQGNARSWFGWGS